NGIQGRHVIVTHPAYPPDDLDKLQPLVVRLITVDRAVALLGGLDVGQARSLGRAASPYSVPLVTPAELPAELLGDNVFSVVPGLAFEGRALAQYTSKELGKSESVCVLADSGREASMAVADAFSKEFARNGKGRVYNWPYKSANDFSELLERI